MKVSRRGRRIKGSQGERELVKILTDSGIPAIRMPLSGAQRGFKSDVKVCLHKEKLNCPVSTYNPTDNQMEYDLEHCAEPRKIEVKRLGQGFKRLNEWLDGSHAVAVRVDRGSWLLCLRLDDYLKDRK